jgi:hypothetical protein
MYLNTRLATAEIELQQQINFVNQFTGKSHILPTTHINNLFTDKVYRQVIPLLWIRSNRFVSFDNAISFQRLDYAHIKALIFVRQFKPCRLPLAVMSK